MGMFYLKKLGHQELGSVENGKPKRGRYFLISKKAIEKKIFPVLSDIQVNDNALLPVYSMDLERKVYCNFVYHNDKFSRKLSNGRDEYRFYLNNDIENNSLFFSEDDIVIFAKKINNNEVDYDFTYFIKKISKTDVNYEYVNKILSEYNVGGGHAICDKDILNLEEQIVLIDPEESQVSISSDVVNQIINQTSNNEKSIEDLFSPTVFRDFVMTGYKRKCAVTGISISYNDLINLEAAHIKPRAHGENNLPSNGIALSRDLHWAFDKGFFTITDDYLIIVHSEVQSDYLKQFDGKRIYVPENEFFRPNKVFLQHHRTHIFGMFKNTGSIRKLNI